MNGFSQRQSHKKNLFLKTSAAVANDDKNTTRWLWTSVQTAYFIPILYVMLYWHYNMVVYILVLQRTYGL